MAKEIKGKTLQKLHEVEMEILDEIDSICKKHNLNYFLVGGTLLGAIRHKGFIPWDDDIDIGMERKDYDKFIEVCKTELSSKYYLDCYETDKTCFVPFAKIRKNNTVFLEEESAFLNRHHGIFVDIFPFDRVKNIGFSLKIKAFLVRTITQTMSYKKKVTKKNELRHPFFTYFLSIFPLNILMRFQHFLMCLNNNKETLYLTAYSGRYNYKKETHLTSTIFPIKDINFENKVYKTLNKPDLYLKNIFGDYMKLPPKDKRINHGAIEISFDTKTSKNK